MSFLKPRVCFAYILHHHSVSWDMIPLKFSSWNITLWTERVNQSTNFQIFQCFNESSPNSSCQVWNHKVKTNSNFASLFSVIKLFILCIFFYLKPLYFGWKEPVEVKFSIYWVVGWKFTKFLLSSLKLQVSFSLSFASVFSVLRDNYSVLFLVETVHDLDKSIPSKCKIPDFWLLT